MPRHQTLFNRISKQFNTRIKLLNESLEGAKILITKEDAYSAQKEEISNLTEARSELTELFHIFIEKADALTELDDELKKNTEVRVDEVSEIYENKIHELKEVIKSLKIQVHTKDLAVAKKADSAAFETIRLQEEKADRRHEELLAFEKQRHNELLAVQRRNIELQEEIKLREEEKTKAVKTSVKLHPIRPMEFNGDPKEFSSFLSNWNATVDTLDLSDGVKLRYLQDALTDEPRKSIATLKSGTQYQLAISMLKKKYGSDLTVKKSYYESLENLNDIRSADDINALRQFSEDVEIICHGLNEYGVNVNNQDFIFHLVFRKLPDSLRLEFSKKIGGMQFLSLKLLMSLLQEHIDIASNISYAKDDHVANVTREEQCFYGASNMQKMNQNKYRGYNSTGNYGNNPQTQAFSRSNQHYSQPKPKSPCFFCGKSNHWNEECREYPTRDARLQKLGSNCLKCFKANHQTDNCFRKSWCPHCSTENTHNRALCPKKFESLQNTTLTFSTNIENVEKSPDITTNPENAFLTSDKTRYIVFPTAVAPVKRSSEVGPKQSCLIAFDSMSSRSYITKTTAQKLGLTKKYHEQLSVHTFASTEPKSISSYRADIDIETKDGTNITVEVSVVNNLEAKVLRAPIESQAVLDQIQSYDLADPRPMRPEINMVDILIGNDFYDVIIQSRRRPLIYNSLFSLFK